MQTVSGIVVVRVARSLAGLAGAPIELASHSCAATGDARFAELLGAALAGCPNRYVTVRDGGAFLERLVAGRARTVFDAEDCRVALVGDEPCGVYVAQRLGAEGRTGTMGFVGILPAWRGRGLGARLHRDALAHLARRGAVAYRDATDAKNGPMLRVFRRNGCAVTGLERRRG